MQLVKMLLLVPKFKRAMPDVPELPLPVEFVTLVVLVLSRVIPFSPPMPVEFSM